MSQIGSVRTATSLAVLVIQAAEMSGPLPCVQSSWLWPPRTQAPPTADTDTSTAPARCSIRRSASTSVSAPRVTWPGPRQCCARRAYAAGRRGPRDRPQIGWRSLTPAEQTIAILVAQGLSNPQIGDRLYVSRRTVQNHLAHVFAKLDITSRAQLAAAATQHGVGLS